MLFLTADSSTLRPRYFDFTSAGISVLKEIRGREPLVEVLSRADVIVNGILQDTERPLMLVREDQVQRLKPGSLIIDVSCDLAMGFPFARPTPFEAPVFDVGRVTYYGVDHSPSYLWRSASWELSRAVRPYLETVMGGPTLWDQDETISRAIERNGVMPDPPARPTILAASRSGS